MGEGSNAVLRRSLRSCSGYWDQANAAGAPQSVPSGNSTTHRRKTVQRAGGWKGQAMVQGYAHLSPDHVRAAVERMARTQSEGGTGTKTGTGETG